MKLYPVGWFSPPSKSFQLFSGGVQEHDQSTPPDFDEMVHVDGKQVVWSAGNGGAQRVYKSYRQVLTAKQALLCSFVGVGKNDDIKSLGVTGDSDVGDSQPVQSNFGGSLPKRGQGNRAPSDEHGEGLEIEDDRCLCVLQGLECVKIYAPDGAEFEVALPCKAARMWALPRGLLIERAVPSTGDDDDSESDADGRGAPRAGGPAAEEPTPMFFSLLHPLEELKPVSFTISRREEALQAETAAMQHQQHQQPEQPVELQAPLRPPPEFQLQDEEESEDAEEVFSEFMCDTDERILFVDNTLCVVVTYHVGRRAHSVWCLLPATAVNATSRNASPASASKRQQRDQPEGGQATPARRFGFDDSMTMYSDDDDDDDDDVIESEVFMQRVWTAASQGEESCDTVFVCHDPEGTPLICLLDHRTCSLVGLSVKSEPRANSSSFSSPAMASGSLLTSPLPTLVRATPRNRVLVDVAFEMKVRSAQPVRSTGRAPVLDMIVVSMQGDLELFRGKTRLCRLEVVAQQVPPLPAEAKAKAKAPESAAMEQEEVGIGAVIKLEHAVSNRVNLVLRSGRSLRVTTAMGFHSRVLRPCLGGLDDALPADLSLNLRVDVAYWYDRISHTKDERIHALANTLAGEEGVARCGVHVDLEWAAFVIVIALLLKGNGAGSTAAAASAAASAAEGAEETASADDWFGRMMASDFHREYEQMHRAALECLGPARPTQSAKAQGWHTELDALSFDMVTEPAAFARHIGTMMLGLHLVYEECKLSTLTWSLLRPIASLLRGIVFAAVDESTGSAYIDHYTRDLGVYEAVPLPALDSAKRVRMSKHAPPDLLSWIGRRMGRAAKTYDQPATAAGPGPGPGPGPGQQSARARMEDTPLLSVIGLSASSATMRPFPELESCFRTQQVCCFFELLSGGSGDEATVAPLEFRLNKDNKRNRATSKSPVVSAFVAMDSSFSHWMEVHGYEARNCAERTVLGMVWYGFALKDLETLSFGLCIPLREALHYCRNRPSGRWPADAYVLVGREDMAALALAPPPQHVPCFLSPDDCEAEAREAEAAAAAAVLDEQQGMAIKTPVITRVQRQEGLAGGGSGASFGSLAALDSTGPRHTGRSRRRVSDASWSTVTTAVTPVWRRFPSGQGVANQVAEDILWGGRSSASRPGRAGTDTFLHQSQQRGQKALASTATSRLLSIVDFARLSASASAEVGTSPSGDHADGDATAAGGADGDAGGVPGDGSASASGGKAKSLDTPSDPSGFHLLQRMTTLRFGSDRRMREVCRLLRSSTPVRLVVERGPEMSDHDLVAAQQARLLLISRRTLALAVGRGMITFGTVRPLLTDTVDIPSISLAGKIPPNNAVVKLDLLALPNGDSLMAWPQFHNGAAAGLRLSAGREVTPLTRTWIAYNRPEAPNNTHAGFLLALGLHGHLAALTMADIYEYLAQGHDGTTVAIMLGLSAAKRASMAPTVSKMLCLHIPSLLPVAFSDMEVPAVVQTAALMGVGILYQGTAHRLMTEFLLAEIGRRPTSDRCADRESYSLAAGLALGMVTLGFGAKPGGLSGLADLRLEDRLHRYMVGGLDPEYAANNSSSAADPTKCSRVREGPYVNVNVTSPGATLALAFIFMKSGNESVAARLAIPDTHFLLDYVRPDLLMLRVLARSLVLWDTVEPTEEWLQSQVPPAIRFSFERLAGGGTTAAAVSAASKVRARHAPAADEDDQIDQYVDEDDDYDEDDEDDEDDYEEVLSPRNNPAMEVDDEEDDEEPPAPPPLPGSTVRPGRQRAMSHGATPSRPVRPSQRIARLKTRGNSMASLVSRVASIGEDSDGKPRRNTGVPVDEQAVRQAHANIVAGACMSIGLRFVGTASQAAKEVLMRYIRHFASMRVSDKDAARSGIAQRRPDRSTLEMCLGASAISLALVMAGTGDLATLRLLRSLRFKADSSTSYGNHMAIGSAIGMVFMGGGRTSFSNDNASIAALVCAFFPRFPLRTDDNQYHLQAMRHLYVLAAEQRSLEAYDIDTRTPCYLPVEIKLRANAMRYYADRVTPMDAPASAHLGGDDGMDVDEGDAGAVTQQHDAAAGHFATSSATVVKMVAPCLLPPLAWISSIRVSSPRYWPVEIELDGEKNVAQRLAICAYRVMCVKRKVGHLSYLEDPRGVSSLLARPRLKLLRHEDRSSGGGVPLPASSDFMRAFTTDPHVLAFAKHFCSRSALASGRAEEKHFAEFCSTSLYDCLTHEKPEMLNLMVDMYQASRTFKHASHSFHVRNVRLLNAFYAERAGSAAHPEEEPLLDSAFLASLSSSIAKEVAPFDADPSLLRTYLTKFAFPEAASLRRAWQRRRPCSDANLATLFATYLHFHGIPEVCELQSMQPLTPSTLPQVALRNKGRVAPHALLKMLSAMKHSSTS